MYSVLFCAYNASGGPEAAHNIPRMTDPDRGFSCMSEEKNKIPWPADVGGQKNKIG